jgi:hypothetical protein
MKINEIFDNALNYAKKQTLSGDFLATFDLNPEINIEIQVQIRQGKSGIIDVQFYSIGPDKDIKDKGQITYLIFSTITQIIQEHVEEYDIEKVRAPANSDKKADIYEKLLNRFSSGWDVYRRGRDVQALKNN